MSLSHKHRSYLTLKKVLNEDFRDVSSDNKLSGSPAKDESRQHKLKKNYSPRNSDSISNNRLYNPKAKPIFLQPQRKVPIESGLPQKAPFQNNITAKQQRSEVKKSQKRTCWFSNSSPRIGISTPLLHIDNQGKNDWLVNPPKYSRNSSSITVEKNTIKSKASISNQLLDNGSPPTRKLKKEIGKFRQYRETSADGVKKGIIDFKSCVKDNRRRYKYLPSKKSSTEEVFSSDESPNDLEQEVDEYTAENKHLCKDIPPLKRQNVVAAEGHLRIVSRKTTKKGTSKETVFDSREDSREAGKHLARKFKSNKPDEKIEFDLKTPKRNFSVTYYNTVISKRLPDHRTKINKEAGDNLGEKRKSMDLSTSDEDNDFSDPSECLAEFLSSIMQRRYADALKYCKMILKYEPQNVTAKEFYPLLKEKLRNNNKTEEDVDEPFDSLVNNDQEDSQFNVNTDQDNSSESSLDDSGSLEDEDWTGNIENNDNDLANKNSRNSSSYEIDCENNVISDPNSEADDNGNSTFHTNMSDTGEFNDTENEKRGFKNTTSYQSGDNRHSVPTPEYGEEETMKKLRAEFLRN